MNQQFNFKPHNMYKKVPQVRISCSVFVLFCVCHPFLLAYFLTRGKQNASTRQIQTSLEHSTISQTLSLGPPFLFAACATFVLQLDLYKHKGQVTVNCCSQFPPLCFIETTLFCSEDLTFETILCPQWHQDTFATPQNRRYLFFLLSGS